MDLRCAGAVAVALGAIYPCEVTGCEWSDWFPGDAAGETPVSLPVYDGVHGTKGCPVCSTWVTV